MAQYRVWQMDIITDKDEVYRDLITEVIGTPFGVQHTVLDEEQFLDFKQGLNYMTHPRPIFFYQEIGKGCNVLIAELVEKGKERRAEYEKRVQRVKVDEAKREAQAKKRKEERERKKYEQMKAKFERGDK